MRRLQGQVSELEAQKRLLHGQIRQLEAANASLVASHASQSAPELQEEAAVHVAAQALLGQSLRSLPLAQLDALCRHVAVERGVLVAAARRLQRAQRRRAAVGSARSEAPGANAAVCEAEKRAHEAEPLPPPPQAEPE